MLSTRKSVFRLYMARKESTWKSGEPFFKQWGGQTATAGGCELGGVEVKQWPQTA